MAGDRSFKMAMKESSEDSVNALGWYVDLSAFLGEALSKIMTSSTFKLRHVKLTTILAKESTKKIKTGPKTTMVLS